MTTGDLETDKQTTIGQQRRDIQEKKQGSFANIYH